MNQKVCMLMAVVLCLFCFGSCSSSHAHVYETKEVVEPTCTEHGYTLYKCECGDSYKSDETAKLGHDAEWVVTKKASCKENGEEEYRCKRCDALLDSKTVSGHNYVDHRCSRARCRMVEPGYIYVGLPSISNFTAISRLTQAKVISIEKKYTHTYDGTYVKTTLIFTIQKTWDGYGASYSRACEIGYKLYDSNNMVVKSGVLMTDLLCVNEKCTVELDIWGDEVQEGQACRLVLLESLERLR